jgi:pimeloyl-ACP methyl ester carboxylesterase
MALIDKPPRGATSSSVVRYRSIALDGIHVFYREAGSAEAPPVLLLHGFPCSSHQFRFLLQSLAVRYHVFVPDFPGFGFSDCPDPSRYVYSFEHYADAIEALTNKFALGRYAIYVHDYGAQVGFRLALRSPKRIAAFVIQNSEAYEEGRTQSWSATEDYWHHPSTERSCHSQEISRKKTDSQDSMLMWSSADRMAAHTEALSSEAGFGRPLKSLCRRCWFICAERKTRKAGWH